MCVGVEDLNKSLRTKPINCFLCGPGQGAKAYDARQALAGHLRTCWGVEVDFGEDLQEVARRTPGTNPLDLQTIESEFAKKVDLTILMLESPGAIAELGSFCMIPEIRSRLYVLVPDRFHGHESYIARGPLDLLARMHSLSVAYYSENAGDDPIQSVVYPVMLHKFARRHAFGDYALALARSRFAKRTIDEAMVQTRQAFLPSYVAATIGILYEPQFTDIVGAIRLQAKELRPCLRELFDVQAIEKKHNRYRLVGGLTHDVLWPFDTGALSRKRCVRLATS